MNEPEVQDENIRKLKEIVKDLCKVVSQQEADLNSLKGSTRAMNLRIYGIDESEDQVTNMVHYGENLMWEVLGLRPAVLKVC